MRTVFDYTDYKRWVNEAIESMPLNGRGVRRRLADATGCQVAYISHVLRGNAHFSMEQVEAAGRFFGLPSAEIEFLVILLSYNRAGTTELKNLLKKQMSDRLKVRAPLKERLRIDEKLNVETQATYYSHWSYAAIHMALTVPGFRTRESLSKYFSLTPARVDQVLNFLVEKNLAKKKGNEFYSPQGALHLPRSSPFIQQHHSNWRNHALNKMNELGEDELHYSGVFSISRDDIFKIREIFNKALESTMTVIKSSREENLMAVCLDFFQP
jgi:uncharacterized protein (TIGR02147 family)